MDYISLIVLIAVIIVALTKRTGCSPISLLPFGTLGSFTGGLVFAAILALAEGLLHGLL